MVISANYIDIRKRCAVKMEIFEFFLCDVTLAKKKVSEILSSDTFPRG